MKRSLIFLLILAICTVNVHAEQQEGGCSIEINIPSHTLGIYSGESLMREYPVCVGNKATPTPQGQYNVVYKTVDPYWLNKDVVVPPGPQNPLGIRWIGMTRSLGIHGNNKPESIGTSVSAGCIRMYNRDVEELYGLVPVNTAVLIVYDRIRIFEDKYGRSSAAIIYPDCYNEGRKNEKKLNEEIENADLDEAIRDKAKKLLWSGQSRPVVAASGTGVFLNDGLITCDAFCENGSIYVNCFAAKDALGLTAELAGIYDIEIKEADGRIYVNLSQTVERLGGKLSFDAKTSNAYIDMKIIKVNGAFLDKNRGNYDKENLIDVKKFENLGYNCEQDAVDIRFFDRQLIKMVRNSKSYISAESFVSALEGVKSADPLLRSVDVIIPPYIKAGDQYFKARCVDGSMVLSEEADELIKNITGTAVEVFENHSGSKDKYIELDVFLEDYDYKTNEYCTVIEIEQQEN